MTHQSSGNWHVADPGKGADIRGIATCVIDSACEGLGFGTTQVIFPDVACAHGVIDVYSTPVIPTCVCEDGFTGGGAYNLTFGGFPPCFESCIGLWESDASTVSIQYEIEHGVLDALSCPEGYSGSVIVACNDGVSHDSGDCWENCVDGSAMSDDGTLVTHDTVLQFNATHFDVDCPQGSIGSLHVHCTADGSKVAQGNCSQCPPKSVPNLARTLCLCLPGTFQVSDPDVFEILDLIGYLHDWLSFISLILHRR